MRACACLLLCLLIGHRAVQAAENRSPERPKRFIYNCDGNNLFIYAEPPMRIEDVYPDIDRAAAAGVTTFSISPNNGMVMSFPGRITRMLGDDADPDVQKQIEQQGRSRPGTLARAALNYRGFVEQGRDAVDIVVERARQKGMEVFLSFRLNEVHGVDHPNRFPSSLIISRFWKDHPEYHIGRPGDPLPQLYRDILGPRTSPVVGSWLPGGLDFAHDAVRQRRLAQIEECLERFDVDGVELDFQRFPMFFRPGQEQQNLDRMTDFVRRLRERTREFGRRRGRRILLSARIMARPEQNRAVGLDVFRWANEGLVDFLIVSHYLRNDFPLPVREYRRLLPESLPLYASIEVEPKAETYRTLARQLYDDGVDGLMMFNYFTRRESGNDPDFDLLRELSSPQTLQADPDTGR